MLLSIEEQIYNRAVALPDKTAIKSGKNIVSYRELWEKILGAKSYFESVKNYNTNNVVIIAAGKQIEFVYAYFGAHLAGLKVAPMDPSTNPTRLSFIIEQINPALLVGFNTEDTTIPQISTKAFSDLKCDFYKPAFPNNDEIADILFTTGTTGKPKGVPLSYGNETAAAENINKFIGNTTQDIELLALPISHSFGLGRLRCCLSIGSTIVLIGSFANINKIFRSFEQDGITGFTMVPASWRYLKKYTGERLGQYANQLQYIEMGSASFSKDEKEELSALLPNTKICMHYGLTEASRSAFMEFHHDIEALDSVGKASPNTLIKIFDESGVECKDGIEGEICIKGQHVMRGYLTTDNESTFFGNYFRTGDWGYIDNQGYLYLISRKKDLINIGGKKVSPQEVEYQLNKLEGIEDCACIGVPDPDGILGEVVKAYIVKHENSVLTTDSINDFLKDRLESYKIPVSYEWIDKIPRTQNGKTQRNLLK